MITNEMLSRFSADFNAEKCHKIAMNAVTQNGVTKSAMSPMALRKDEHQFSINLKQAKSPTRSPPAAAGCSRR